MRTIPTYERLISHVKTWIVGQIPFLLITGKPGLGKSHIYEDMLADQEYTLFKGRTSAFHIYKTSYDNPARRIVFDDVGQLLRDPACVELMKSLCDSRTRRVVQWNTSTNLLEGRSCEFTATAPVLVVCNHSTLDNPDVQAVLDRADAISFEPSRQEIINRLRTFADDEEIVGMFEELPILPSLRTYEKAVCWKRSPYLDLREELLAECGVGDEVVTLLRIMEHAPQSDWRQAYMHRTGRSRRDYFNKLKIARQLLVRE